LNTENIAGIGVVIVKNKEMTRNFMNKLCNELTVSRRKALIVDCFAFFLSRLDMDEKKECSVDIEIPEMTFYDWLRLNLENFSFYNIIILNDINTIFHELSHNQPRGASQKLWRILLILSKVTRHNNTSCFLIVHEMHRKRSQLAKIYDFTIPYDA
jgi:hypothetical protein